METGAHCSQSDPYPIYHYPHTATYSVTPPELPPTSRLTTMKFYLPHSPTETIAHIVIHCNNNTHNNDDTNTIMVKQDNVINKVRRY